MQHEQAERTPQILMHEPEPLYTIEFRNNWKYYTGIFVMGSEFC